MVAALNSEAQFAKDTQVILRPDFMLENILSSQRLLIDEPIAVMLPAGARVKYVGKTKRGMPVFKLVRADIGPQTALLFASEVPKERQRQIQREYRNYIFMLETESNDLLLWM